MDDHLISPPPRRKQTRHMLAIALSIGCMSACDKLWGGFAIDDPTSCAVPNSQVVCQPPLNCNPNNGKCEEAASIPLSLTSISPGAVGVQGGGPVVVTGTGFTKDTVVKIAGQALLAPTLVQPGIQITGSVPRSPGRCGPVDVELSRPSSISFKKTFAFTYLFDPPSYGGDSLFGSVGAPPARILIGNLDADPQGRLDLLVRTTGGIWILNNQGGGIASSKPLLASGLPKAQEHIAIARIAGKPHPDIVVASTVDSSIYFVSFDESANQYSASASKVTITKPVNYLLSGDANHDGNDEVVAVGVDTMTMTSDVSVIFRQDNSWSATPIGQTITTLVSDIVNADVNGDGIDDLVLTSGNSSTLTFMGWNGSTLNSITSDIRGPNTLLRAVVAGDWNGDNKTDLAFLSKNNGIVYIVTNQSNSWSSVPIALPFTPDQTSIVEFQARDLTCDARPEIIVNQFGTTSGISILRNDGQGNFSPLNRSNQSPPGGPLAIGDFNDDGLPDIVVGKTTAMANSQIVLQAAKF